MKISKVAMNKYLCLSVQTKKVNYIICSGEGFV